MNQLLRQVMSNGLKPIGRALESADSTRYFGYPIVIIALRPKKNAR